MRVTRRPLQIPGRRTAGWMAALCGALSLTAGCTTTNLDICHAKCESVYRCIDSSSSSLANCHTACDNNRGALSDQDRRDDDKCKNSGAIRAQSLSCYNQECSKILSCLGQVEGCVTK